MSKLSFSLLSLSLIALPLQAKDKLSAKPWADKSQVKNLVSLSVDDNGDVYVSETTRRKAADLDIRAHSDWVPDDVGLETIEDKKAFYHKILSPKRSDKNKAWLKDSNGDGSHDYKDLRSLTEKIHRLRDTNGDGKADEVVLYADNFNTEVTGINAGVLIHDGEVYSTIAPDVWKLKDTNQDGKADQRQSIAHGFGVHIAYAGHDMHGLRIGPDGRLYWSIGDKGLSVVDAQGNRHHYPNQGAVMRCDLDGGNFEVFAYGLRNIQEFAFDEFGNMFGVDNDSDRSGETERFVYITKGSDSGWRCNYQYRGSGYNPWMKENLWIPYHEGQAHYITPPISKYLDGPTGFAYNPGTALSKSYEKHFFMTMFPKKTIMAFKVAPKGAGFEMQASESVFKGVNLTGICFGPKGDLWASDWGGGYPLNDIGGVFQIDVNEALKHPERDSTHQWMTKNYSLLAPSDLLTGMAHPDQRVRMKCQFELVKRDAIPELIALSGTHQESLLSRIHGIWGLSQLARQQSNMSITQHFIKLLDDTNPEVIAQSLKALMDLKNITLDGQTFSKLLSHPNSRVQYFAAMALSQHPSSKTEASLKEITEWLAQTQPNEVYQRHAAIMALTALPEASLSALSQHSNKRVKLAAIVALRRLKSPEVASFLNDPDEDILIEAAMAIHDDFSITEALPELANLIKKGRVSSERLWRRVLNANFRIPLSNNSENIAKFIQREDQPLEQRLEAFTLLHEHFLPHWADRVDGRARKPQARDLNRFKNMMSNYIESYLESPSQEIQAEASKLSKKLNIQAEPKTLLSWLKDSQRKMESRLESLRYLLEHPVYSSEASQYAITSNIPHLRTEAIYYLLKTQPRVGMAHTNTILKKGEIWEKQQIILALGQLDDKKSIYTIEKLLKLMLSNKAEKELTYELLQAAKARGLDKYVSDYGKSMSKKHPQLGEQVALSHGGDALQGEKIFKEHLAAQCIRCHALNGVGSTVGPDLAKIGAKQPSTYLLESLLLPGKDIATGYGQTSLTLKNGNFMAGALHKEDQDSISLKTPDGKVSQVKRSDIANQSPVMSMMPSMKGILKDSQIRDVVAYLATLK